MYNRRYNKCCCMNNSNDNCNQNNIEKSCPNCNSISSYNDDCDCGFDDDYQDVFPMNPMLGQSYVPYQYMNETFLPNVGLKMGTIFPELVSPYYPCQSFQEIDYIRNSNTIGKGCNS